MTAARRGRHRVRRALVTAEVALAVMLVDRRRAARAHRRQSRQRRRRVRSIADGHVFDDAAAAPSEGGRARAGVAAVARYAAPDARRAGRHRHVRSAAFTGWRSATTPASKTHRRRPGRDRGVLPVRDGGLLRDNADSDRRGSWLRPSDTASGGRVAVINETLARRLWKGRDPIGQRLRPNLGASIGTSANPWHTVIGVAKDVKEAGVDRDAWRRVLLFVDQPGPPIDDTARWVTTAPPTMHVVLRTRCRRRRSRRRSSERSTTIDPVGADRRPARDGRRVRRIDRPAETAGAAARPPSPASRCCWPSSAPTACSRSWSPSGAARSASASPSARRAATSSRW